MLAVIVILAVIALIAIPLIMGVVEKARRQSFAESINRLFNAYDLYLTDNNFNPDPTTLSVIDERLNLKSNFETGTIFLNKDKTPEIEQVTDGEFCATGTKDDLKITAGRCENLDESGPEVTISANLITSSSIKIVVEAKDSESGIKGYYYSKDDGKTYTEITNANTYIFDRLVANKEYPIKVKVVNNKDIETVKSLKVTTLNLTMPSYTVNPSGWAKSKTVTITYPTITNQTLTYEYSTNAGSSWITATQSQKVTFNANGTIIARVKDGTNTVTATTFTVNQIDNEGPEIAVSASTYDWVPGSITLTVTGKDTGSGISGSAYSINGGSYSTTNTYTTSAAGNISIKVKDVLGNENSTTVKIESRTEYGYQDVSSWSSSYTETYHLMDTIYQKNNIEPKRKQHIHKENGL